MFRRRPRHFRGRRRVQSASSEEEPGPGVEGGEERQRQGPVSPDPGPGPPRLPEAPTVSARGQEAAEDGGEGGARQARGGRDLLSFGSDEEREGRAPPPPLAPQASGLGPSAPYPHGVSCWWSAQFTWTGPTGQVG